MALHHDLLFGLRMLRRSPGFALAAVLTLALGIGANTAIYSVVRAVLLRSYGYRDTARLVQIPKASLPDFHAIQARARSFESVGAHRLQTFTLLGGSEPENLYGLLVSPECFEVLGAAPTIGRSFAAADFAADAPPAAIIAHSLWERSFGNDSSILGRRVILNGTEHTVVGVMPADFEFTLPLFRVWTPWRPTAADRENRTARPYTLIARLRPGVTREAAQAELQTLSLALAAEFPAGNKDWRALAEPVNEPYIGGLRPVLYTLLGAAGFVLLIACINVSNLLTARGLDRSREMTIRSALGAPRLRLIRQLLTESLVIASLGGALGLLFAHGCLKLLHALLPAGAMPGANRAALDMRVLAASLLATVAAGAIAGIVPALRASAGARADRGTPWRSRFQTGLIVVETALSIILLAGAGLLIRSFQHMLQVDTGFRPEQVLTVQIPSEWTGYNAPNDPAATARRMQYFQDVVARVRELPGVTAAGITTVLPLGMVQINTRIYLRGGVEELRLAYRAVSPEYFRAMGIPLVRGRAFTADDRTGAAPVVIVSDAFARRYWPGEDAVGKQLTFGDPRRNPEWSTVVGVVGGVRYERLTAPPEPELYTSYQQKLLAPQMSSIVVRTSRDPAELAPSVRTAVHQVNPNQPVTEVKPLTRLVSDARAQARLFAALLAIFAALALLLAAAGIASVISWTVARSTREIGIRMALGARPRDVLLTAARRAMLAVIAGAAVGLAGAAGLTRLLRAQLFGVTPADPATYAAVAILLLAVAAAAAYIPARRAAAVDPMLALRGE